MVLSMRPLALALAKYPKYCEHRVREIVSGFRVARFRGNPKSLSWCVLLQSRACWPHLAGIAALSLLSLPLTLLYPLPLKIAVDSVLGEQALPEFLGRIVPAPTSQGFALVLAIALLLGISVLVNLQALASWWLQTYTGEKLVWDFRAELFNHVQRLPLAFHDRYGATDSVYRIQHDAPSIQYFAIQGIIPLLTSAATLAGMLYVAA
jgi:ATP-binding cassette, subfamily B, bacterial